MDGRDDIEVAPDGDEEAGEGRAEARVKKLRNEITTLRKEKQEYMDGWQRAKADYVNALRRFEEEGREERERGVAKAVEALLPAFDALNRAKTQGEVPAGFAGIARQLESAFIGLGLESIGRENELFNPAVHEALGQDETDKCEIDDTVSAVLEEGWKIGDFLIRPAKVRVHHYKA